MRPLLLPPTTTRRVETTRMTTNVTDTPAKATSSNLLQEVRRRDKCEVPGNISKSGGSTPLVIGIVLGIAILIGMFAYQTHHVSREELEKQAGEMVTQILSDNNSFSSVFTVREVANCLLVESGENTYSGSIDAVCKWKDASLKERMRSLFVEAAGANGGVRVSVVEEFERQLVDPMTFKFDVDMVHDGSRCSVSCRAAAKQPSPANEVVLALLGLGGDD